VNRAEIAGVAVVALLVALVIAFRAMWRVPKPNEALLVTGFGARGGGSGGAQSLVEQEPPSGRPTSRRTSASSSARGPS
jgi:hypothetical protein